MAVSKPFKDNAKKHHKNRILEIVPECCSNVYNQLPSSFKPPKDQWTNLAGVVMETNGAFLPVSVATGTKCLPEAQKSSWLVSDSHAEILAIKLFRRYLLEEIHLQGQTGSSEVLALNSSGTFTLRDSVKFHFYTSCVMCGDATISPTPVIPSTPKTERESPLSKGSNPSKRRKLDTRTGAKSLASDTLEADTLQARSWGETGSLRTKPGRGPPTLSLSCSDKLMKGLWCGVEGGLLAPLFHVPVTFASVTVGGDVHVESVTRALITRVKLDRDWDLDILISHGDGFTYGKKSVLTDTPSNTSLLWVRSSTPGLSPTGNVSNSWRGVNGKKLGAAKLAPPSKVMLPICQRAMLHMISKISPDFEGISDSLALSEAGFKSLYKTWKDQSEYPKKKSRFMSQFKGWDVKQSKKAALLKTKDSK